MVWVYRQPMCSRLLGLPPSSCSSDSPPRQSPRALSQSKWNELHTSSRFFDDLTTGNGPALPFAIQRVRLSIALQSLRQGRRILNLHLVVTQNDHPHRNSRFLNRNSRCWMGGNHDLSIRYPFDVDGRTAPSRTGRCTMIGISDECVAGAALHGSTLGND
jgi:hypothetical protein